MRLRITDLYLEVILRRGIHLLELLFGSASDKESTRRELTVCPRPMMALPASENVRAKGEWTTCTVDIPDQPCVGKKSSRGHTRRGLRSRSIPFYTSKDEPLRDLREWCSLTVPLRVRIRLPRGDIRLLCVVWVTCRFVSLHGNGQYSRSRGGCQLTVG